MTFCDYREVFFMYQSEGTGRERKGEISQRRKQNEIIIITILAVIMTAVMFANILENPKISDQSANEKEKMEKISNKTKTDGINNKKIKRKELLIKTTGCLF